MEARDDKQPVKLEYYMFDWDDNILHMPTLIHLERKTDEGWKPYSVTTAHFARIRRDTESFRPVGGDWDTAFRDFYDVGERGDQAFVEDTRSALAPIIQHEKTGAPSFRRFKKALIEGRLFAIITARAHASASIRQGVEFFIENVLSDAQRRKMIRNLRRYHDWFGEEADHLGDREILRRYLDLNRYRGVSSPEFQDLMGRKTGGSESPERAKQVAIRDFVRHVIGLLHERGVEASISMGFSDDDPHNVDSIETFLDEELAREFPDIKFVVYDTSDAGLPNGRKIIIRGK